MEQLARKVRLTSAKNDTPFPGGPNPEAPVAEETLLPEGIPSPEDFRPRPPRPVTPLDFWPALRFVLLPLVFAALALAATGAPELAVSGQIATTHEFWRLLTAVFAHADLNHYLSNVPSVVFLGWILRGYFGLFAFPVLGLLIGVVSNAFTVAVYPPHVQLLGASGMVFGLYSLWITWYVLTPQDKPLSRRILHGAGVAVLTLAPGWARDNVSHLAHGSGFVLGILVGLAAYPFVSLLEDNIPGYQRARMRPRRRLR